MKHLFSVIVLLSVLIFFKINTDSQFPNVQSLSNVEFDTGGIFVWNDEIQINRTKNKQVRLKIGEASPQPNSYLFGYLNDLCINLKINYPYPFSSNAKQDPCFGLLFLQYLF